jgi:uncharacterized protein YjiS (DUF1127 family)
MAIYSAPKPAPFGAITAHRIIGSFEAAWTALKLWSDRRVTRRALLQLSDHQLEDIGLMRGTVQDIR